MEKFTVKAFNEVVENGKRTKVFVGETILDKPANLDEAKTLVSEDEILKGWWKSHVIAKQAAIRDGSDEKKARNALVKRLVAKAESDPEVAALLKKYGISL